MKNRIILVSLYMSMLLFAGCSVKEDRMTCPCRLVLDFSKVDTSVIEDADIYLVSEDGFTFSDRLVAEAFSDNYVIDIPRHDVDLGIWSGTWNRMDGGGVDIPYGEDCPPVYFHTAALEADGESVRELVMMRKNHCVMTVMLGWDDEEINDVILIGNVDGYEADGSPSIGEFSYKLSLDDDGTCRAVLPRQVDDSLQLEVNDGSGVVKRFSLGEYIAECGYDWTEPDLKDMTIELDMAVLMISLTIQGWDTTHKFDVVI